MSWFAFLLLAGLTLVLQTTVAPRLELLGARADGLLVVAVFLGLYGRKFPAVVQAWLLGLAGDMLTIERFGLLSLSYSLVALLIVLVREELFRYQGSTQFFVTLFCGILLRGGWHLLRGAAATHWWDIPIDVLLASAYTAMWALLIQQGLLRLAPLLGLPPRRYTHAGL